MARDYGKVSPKFWTGETGRKLRAAGRDAQVVGLYLLTCPSSSMIGLYYLPIPTISHEVGIPLQGAYKALLRVCEAGFCSYSEQTEYVWVPEMAAYQIGEPLDIKDNRVKGIIREWQDARKSGFYGEFHKRYAASFHLPEQSPYEAPSKPLRSQEHEQEQLQEQEPNTKSGRYRGSVFVPPDVDEVRAHCLKRKNGIDPEEFVAYYQARGWVMTNGKKVSDWKACVVTWEKMNAKRTNGIGSGTRHGGSNARLRNTGIVENLLAQEAAARLAGDAGGSGG